MGKRILVTEGSFEHYKVVSTDLKSRADIYALEVITEIGHEPAVHCSTNKNRDKQVRRVEWSIVSNATVWSSCTTAVASPFPTE